MKKPYAIIIFLLGLIVALSVGKAVLYNMLSTSGVFVDKVEREISLYRTQNIILSEELLASSSLTNISKKAQESGFTNKNTSMVIEVSRPLAVRP